MLWLLKAGKSSGYTVPRGICLHSNEVDYAHAPRDSGVWLYRSDQLGVLTYNQSFTQ